MAAIPTKEISFPSPLQRYTDRFQIQYGIPYNHDIFQRLERREVIKKADFHCFWWLNQSLDKGDTFLRIEKPHEVVRANRHIVENPFISRPDPTTSGYQRHRPTQPNLKRQLSTWELADVADIKARVRARARAR